MSFDLDHAFDRVDRFFLHNTMCALGINERFVQLLSTINNQCKSRILINGHISPAFPIERSVRQGDPISMILFVIYLQPLLMNLENICNPDDLIVAYADDITLISTSVQVIQRAREIFAEFQLAAGAMLNVQKTVSIDVGHINGNNRLLVP